MRGSSLSKEDYHKFLKVTNSSPDGSDGHDHQQFMFLHDWKVRTLPPPHNKKDSDWLMILAASPGNLSISNQKIFSGNIQHSFCSYLYPGICICFVFSSRIPHKSYKSAATRWLPSRSESEYLIDIGHVFPVSLKEQFWRVSGSLEVPGSLKVPYRSTFTCFRYGGVSL